MRHKEKMIERKKKEARNPSAIVSDCAGIKKTKQKKASAGTNHHGAGSHRQLVSRCRPPRGWGAKNENTALKIYRQLTSTFIAHGG